jgi:transposase-like protein
MAKDNRANNKYTKEEKEKLIARMLPPEQISTRNLSIETGISQSTLATWKTVSTHGSTSKRKRNKSSKDKFMVVMETYTLAEIELSKYCRENGLYVDEVKAWRSSCIAANDGVRTNSLDLSDELKEEKKKSKELARDLRYKEKALAETAALLVLKKKLGAIFGDNEED